MANPDAAFGFRPVRKIDGSDWNGMVMTCHVPATDSTALGIGDPVKLAGSAGSVDGEHSFPTVTRAAAGDAVFGVMIANHVLKHDDTIYRAASEARDIRVCPAKDVVWHIQCDGSVAVTDVGDTADFVVTGGVDTVTGLSDVELDSSDIGTGAGLQILGIPNVVRNGEQNSAGTNAVVEVKINESQLANGAAGV